MVNRQAVLDAVNSPWSLEKPFILKSVQLEIDECHQIQAMTEEEHVELSRILSLSHADTLRQRDYQAWNTYSRHL